MKKNLSLRVVLLFLVSAMMALTSNTLYALCTPVPSCIYNWWPAESNAVDIVSGDNGTLVNGAGYSVGLVGDAFGLTKSSHSYVQATNDPVWGFGTNDFTVELWVNFKTWNPTGSYGYPDAVFIGDDDAATSYKKWFFAINSGKLTFHINGPTLGPIWLVNASFSPVTNQWYHLAVTRQGNVFTIYTNGVVAGSTTYSVVIPTPSAPLTIGQAEGLGYIDGLIDEPSIYRCALSQSEIQDIYNAGSYGKCR